MGTTQRTTRVFAGTFGLGLALLLGGCDDAPPPAPTPRVAREPRAPSESTPSTPQPSTSQPSTPSTSQPSTSTSSAQTPSSTSTTDLAGDVLAPTRYAPAFGLAVGDGLAIDVDPDSGDATFFELDADAGFVAVRRARTSGVAGRAGMFGRGWRGELESSLEVLAGGVIVRRLQGASAFAPSGVDDGETFVSVLGDLEVLRRDATGWTLVQQDGRVLGFDGAGRVDLLDGATIERAPGRLSLVSGASRVEVALDARGRATSITGAGVSLRYGYDAAGELVSVAGDRARAYGVVGGRVARIGSGEATLVVAAHDADGRVSRLERGDGWTQEYAFGTASDGAPEASVTTPHGRTTCALRIEASGDARWDLRTPRGEERVWFDGRGRIAARQRAGEPRSRVLGSDPITAPALEVMGVATPAIAEQETDAHGRVTADVLPTGRVTYGWDAEDRLTSVTTPAGRAWTFGWTGRRITRQDGPAGEVELEHDRRGNLATRRDSSGREWTAVHDDAGRPTLVQAASGEAVSFERDAQGRLVAADGPAGRLVLEHGATDERVRVTDEATGVALDYAVQGPLTETVTTPWGALRQSVAGRAITRSTPAGSHRFEHDERGLRTSVAYPGGLTVTWTHDASGRAASIVARRGGRTLVDVASAWSATGERTSTVRDGVETRFEHDAAGRLVLRARGAETVRWAHDADDVRVREARCVDGGREVAREARLDARGRLERLGDERFVHDAAGRVTERHHAGGVDRFGYDGFGRLARVARAGAPAVEWTRDALGRIATRTVEGRTTRFVHDGDRLLAELRQDGSTRVWLNGVDADEPLGFVDIAEGESLADAVAAGRRVDLLLDDQGHGLAAVDARGAVTRLAVSPWGEPEVELGQDERAIPALFAGRAFDPVARVYHLRARAYDPSLGRFLQPDPAGLTGGLDPWTYCEGRPLDRTDPLGLWSFGELYEGAKNKAAALADTVVGAGEGLAYLTGLKGDAAAQAAAREASASDITSGRAQSRALGALDAYTQAVTFGLVDPNTSRFAYDQAQAQRGRAYGEAGGVVFAVASAAPLLRAAPGVIWSGVRALPRAPGAIAAGLRALPSVPGRLVAAAGSGLDAAGRGLQALPATLATGARAVASGARALPTRALDALGWLARNPLRSINAVAKGLGWRVLGRPFASLVAAVSPRARHAFELLRRLRLAEETAEAGRAAALAASPATRAAGAALGAATGLDDVARLATSADDAGRAVASTADDALRTGTDAATAAREAPPTDGLVQALGGDARAASTATPPRVGTQPQTPRAPPVATAAEAAEGIETVAIAEALEADCVFVATRNGGLRRIGNFDENPAEVLEYIRRYSPESVVVSNLEEAQALKAALRNEPGIAVKPRVFADAPTAPRPATGPARSNYDANRLQEPAARTQPVRNYAAGQFESRSAAFRQAKRDAGIGQTEAPFKVVDDIPLDGLPRRANNSQYNTRNYHFRNAEGQEIVIQEHSVGHEFLEGVGDQGPHFNVRPVVDQGSGKVPGTLEHYGWPSE